MATPPVLQGQISQPVYLDSLNSDNDFLAAPQAEQMQYLMEDFLPKNDPEFAKAPAEEQQAYINEVVLPGLKVSKVGDSGFGQSLNQGVTPWQGIQNLGGSIVEGLGNFGQAVVNPGTYQQIGQNIGDAFNQEIQTRMAAPQDIPGAIEKGLMSTPLGLAPGALQGVKDLAQGVVSLPADIANAYQGKQVYQPAVQLPEISPELRQKYPVTSFVGEQVPYALPVGKAAQATKLGKLSQLGRAAAEGAAIGAVIDPREAGLKGRVSNAAMGASLPAALGAGGAIAGKALKRLDPINGFGTRMGTIHPDITKATGLKGDIVLEHGTVKYGRAHIEKATEKLRKMVQQGFVKPDGTADVDRFVKFVTDHVNEVIDEGDGKYMFVVHPESYTKVVKPVQKQGRKFNSVVTSYPNRPSNIRRGLEERGWKSVWKRRNPDNTQAGSLEAPVSGTPAKKTGQSVPGARSQTDYSQGSTSTQNVNPAKVPNRAIEPVQERAVFEKIQPEKQESGRSQQPQDIQNPGGAGEQSGVSERASKYTGSAETAQALKEKVQEFRGSQSDTKRMALAAQIHSMAQEVDRGVFTEALKDIPQDVINEIGKRLGC